MPRRARVYQPWPGTCPGPWASLWLESCGYRDCQQPTLQLEAGFTCVHLVTHGLVRYRHGDQVDVVLGSGSLFGNWFGDRFALTAGPSHAGADVGLQWIRLFGPAAGAYLEALGLTAEEPYRSTSDPAAIARIMQRLVRLGREQPPGAAFQALSLLYAIPTAAGVVEHGGDRPEPLAARARAAMVQNLSMGMNVEQVCRAFGVSRTTLFEAFRETYRRSPMAVLTELRINHAKRLLRETAWPVAEVAAAAGYSDVSYFGRRFGLEVGCTPSEYRQKGRG